MICGGPFAAGMLAQEVDHVVLLKIGGSQVIENLPLTHKGCNGARPRDG